MAGPLTDNDPRRLGDYELMRRLGEGGMGTVYLGRTPRGAPVAVKTLRDVHADNRQLQSRFRREVDATLLVGGAYVARVIDADLEAGIPYFVTEFIAGDTLEQHVNRHGPMQGDRLVALAGGIAIGIAELHAAGVAHRDLSPRNVVLSSEGPKLIDLGIAYVLGATRMTATGTSMGTPLWMAPEHARGGDVGAPADVFGWGSLILYAATGQPPFGEGRAEAVLYRIVHDEPDTSALEGRLRSAVEQALQKDPDERPPALELAAAITGAEPDLVATTAVAATMLQRTLLAQTAPVAAPFTTEQLGTHAMGPAQPEAEPVAVGQTSNSRSTSLVAAAVVLVVATAIAAWALWSPGDGTVEQAEPAAGTSDSEADAAATATPSSTPTQDLQAASPLVEPTASAPEPSPDQTSAAAPRPVDPEAPWAVPAETPTGVGEVRAAEWWTQWGPADCNLYLPLGLEETNDVELDGPTATRFDDVHFGWWHPNYEPFGLDMTVHPTDSQAIRGYFDQEPFVFADGSEVYADDSGDSMRRLIAIAGENCFYEVDASNMNALSWGVDALRQVRRP